MTDTVGSVPAGPSEHGQYRVSRAGHPHRCGHRLISVVPIVSMRVEDGYAGRCLLCGTIGPVRGNEEDAQRVLLEKQRGW